MSGLFSGMAGFGRRIQSDLVLRTARGFYLIAACVSLAVIVIALIVAALAQASTFRFAIDEPVPAVRPPQTEAIEVADIAAYLNPPSNIRFVQQPNPITDHVYEGQLLGYFDADSAIGLDSYPDDFDILGGAGAALVSLDRAPNGHAGLRATAALADSLSAEQSRLSTTASHALTLRVIARDRAGLRSAPTDLAISLLLGPPGAAAPEAQPAPAAAPTALQELARDIALAVDPNHTDAYFDVLRQALQTPTRCGADNTPEFVAQYRRGFEGVRDRLSTSNVGLFFVGVCEAWARAVQRGETRSASEAAAAAAAEARNMQARLALEAQKVMASAVRNVALGVFGAALMAFLTIALFLAFLAMEGHSKALREAVEALANQSRP